MQHHLVTVARRAPVQPAGQRALGQPAQRVRLPLPEAPLHADRLVHRVRRLRPGGAGGRRRAALRHRATVRHRTVRRDRTAAIGLRAAVRRHGGLQRPPEHRPHLRRQPAPTTTMPSSSTQVRSDRSAC
ncbi:MAG: hypothetical protein OXH69_17735, partial [Acidobacteria bacterium]|nr:hypothetical protein [Acidobacteriota bacterium]